MLTMDTARKLAVRYSAYMRALAECNDLEKVVWGPLLRDIQTETGVELLPAWNLEAVIGAANDRLDRQERQRGHSLTEYTPGIWGCPVHLERNDE